MLNDAFSPIHYTTMTSIFINLIGLFALLQAHQLGRVQAINTNSMGSASVSRAAPTVSGYLESIGFFNTSAIRWFSATVTRQIFSYKLILIVVIN